MKRFILIMVSATLLCACQESLENRAERESKEYTQRMCPTPIYNNTRTDSVTFDKATKTYTYHCSFFNVLDDSAAINRVKDQLYVDLRKGITEDTHIKAYKEAGFNFHYLCHSAKNPKIILFEALYKAQDVTGEAK